jgi:hypothetical protein
VINGALTKRKNKMQVRVIRSSIPADRILHTLELTASEVPRKDDTVSFDGIKYTVDHVCWKYSRNVGSIIAEHGRLIGVDIYV